MAMSQSDSTNGDAESEGTSTPDDNKEMEMTHEYERGDYFKVQNDPRVTGLVIIAVGNIGYDGYRVAEKDTDTDNWRAYWVKAQHIHDEVNINGLEGPREVGKDVLDEVEANLPSEPAESPNPVPEVTIGDVMPDFVDYSTLPTKRDGSIDRTTLENDPDAPELPEESALTEGE
jgi:hypothetical protein